MITAGRKELNRAVAEALERGDFDPDVPPFDDFPTVRLTNILIGLLSHPDGRVANGAIRRGGALISRLAERDLPAARVIMRRLVWNLTEESGGCPWGTPELMGEAMACNPALAEEFGSILLSYIDPDSNFLEYPPLLASVVRGIARLGESQPELLQQALPHLKLLAQSEDPELNRAAASLLGSADFSRL